MRVKKIYLYVIENWQNGVPTGETISVFKDLDKAKEKMMWHISAQKKIEGDACKTIGCFDKKYEKVGELAPVAGLWKFDEAVLYCETETSGGKFVGTGRTIRAIFEKDVIE